MKQIAISEPNSSRGYATSPTYAAQSQLCKHNKRYVTPEMLDAELKKKVQRQ